MDAAARAYVEDHQITARLSPSAMRHVLDRPDLQIFVGADTATTIMAPDAGIVIGRIFARDRGTPLASLDQDATAAARGTAGRSLIERCWGGYVAVMGATADRPPAILRDPSGAVPVYCARIGAFVLWFSDIAVPLALGLIIGRVDPMFAVRWLSFPHLRGSRTGLLGVDELLPGMMVSADLTMAPQSAWSPWDHATAGQPLMRAEDAAALVREEVIRCITAYAQGHDRILLELSGGLDSSVIAAALGAAAIPFSAVNLATEARDGDERRYARAVAATVGAPIAELVGDDGHDGLTAPPALCRVRPENSPVLRMIDRMLGDHAAATRADLVVSGTGGDNVFCYITTAAPVLDALMLAGPHQALTTLRDVSMLCDCTWWTTARYALRKARRYRNGPSWRAEQLFLNPAIAVPEPDYHPWQIAPSHALPGKREHIDALVRVQDFLDANDRTHTCATLYPLLAQPIVELCLRIPSWMWVRGGRNRSVARDAFAVLLPAIIIERRSKGRLEGMSVRAFMQTRPALAELLLGGTLAREHIIDREAIASYLRRDQIPRDQHYFRIFDCANLELWLQSWTGHQGSFPGRL